MSAMISLPNDAPMPAPASLSPAGRRAVVAAAGTLLLTALVWFGMPSLADAGRVSLLVFALAIIGWTVLRLPELPVAIAGAGALVVFGATTTERFYRGLGDALIWLLIGAFILAAVIRASGLAERLALRAVAGATSVRALFHRLALVIAATAFVVPSTSGRAALLLPVFLALTGALAQPRLTRALALLFPSVILLSAGASLLGAGAHLVAVDFIARLGLPAPGFAQWALLGTPFALACCVVATEIVLRLFLSPAERAAQPVLPARPAGSMPAAQKAVLAIAAATVAAWATANWHGVEPALIALAGALAATQRRVTGIAMKEALKSVEWSLILFLAATLAMGEALLDSGAAQWLADAALAALPSAVLSHPAWILCAVVVAAMFSHLLITSRSARAAVLIPTLALPLAVLPEQAALLVMVATLASGFCQTFKVSAKPVMLYARSGEAECYSDADLLRLSLALMPAFALLLVACALWFWPLLGFDGGAAMLFDTARR